MDTKWFIVFMNENDVYDLFYSFIFNSSARLWFCASLVIFLSLPIFILSLFLFPSFVFFPSFVHFPSTFFNFSCLPSISLGFLQFSSAFVPFSFYFCFSSSSQLRACFGISTQPQARQIHFSLSTFSPQPSIRNQNNSNCASSRSDYIHSHSQINQISSDTLKYIQVSVLYSQLRRRKWNQRPRWNRQAANAD